VGIVGPMQSTIIAVAVAWELFWKGIGLWKSAKNDQKYWFVAMLIFNTLGMLPILYLFVFQKGRKGL
jgi:hypothetical protein